MVFAYLLESHPIFGPQVRTAYQVTVSRGDRLCTSTFTLGELLVLPKRMKNQPVITAITEFLRSGEVEIIPFSWEAAERYSTVRADTRVKAADAIHLASAIEARVDLFVTNHRALQKLRIPGMPFIAGLDGKVF